MEFPQGFEEEHENESWDVISFSTAKSFRNLSRANFFAKMYDAPIVVKAMKTDEGFVYLEEWVRSDLFELSREEIWEKYGNLKLNLLKT